MRKESWWLKHTLSQKNNSGINESLGLSFFKLKEAFMPELLFFNQSVNYYHNTFIDNLKLEVC